MNKLLKDEEKAENEAHKLEHAFSFDSAEILNNILEGKRKVIEESLEYIG